MAKECDYCNGTGKCARCDGTGNIKGNGVHPEPWLVKSEDFVECPVCYGNGYCPYCNGSGKTY